APEDYPEHPAARGPARLPVRAHEEGDRGEHPRAEHECEVAESGRDVGVRPEGVPRGSVDDPIRPGDQVSPSDEGRIDRREEPRSTEPRAPGRIGDRELVERGGHQDERYPGEI